MRPLDRPTPLSGWIDRIGLRVMIIALSVGWFYLLWARLWPALAAGVALAALWMLALHLGEKRTFAAREMSLRRRIGGQLAVDSLALQSATSAAANAATWISGLLPLSDFEQTGDGVIARSEDRRVYIQCVRKHQSSRAGRDDVIGAVRAAREYGVDVCVVCATCPFASEAVLFAEEIQPRTRLLGREGLVRIAGTAAPATNEQLQELGRRQRNRRFDPSLWKERLLQPGKGKRYGLYGLGMLAMLIVTRHWAYALPSAVCLLLFYMSGRRKVKAFEL
ncbi:MAG: restriction endonuclease [Oscillospiraceae bacterium]|jgi:hypothetical protein|nr:restriction endonuclease [Oscillospiraceae bacterium]